MNKFNLFLLLVLFSFLAYGQSEKEIKQNKVKSITSWQTDQEDGKTSTYKELYEMYDKNGNTTLSIKYKKDGTVNSKETFKYDKNQNKLEEIEYDGENKIVNHTTYTYNSFQKKVEEKELSPKGDLIKKTIFTYTPAGEKATEITTDVKGSVLKKIEYKYNPKNMKILRTTSNKSKQEETTKKWAYEFY